MSRPPSLMLPPSNDNTGLASGGYNCAMTSTEKRIIDLLQAKQKEDPEGFRRYLPTVADLLPAQLPKTPSTPPFGPTEKELAFHESGLREVLNKIDSGDADGRDAIKGLQHYANIKVHDSFSMNATHDMAKRLFKTAFGKSPSSYKSKITIPVDAKDAGPVKEHVTVLRGVYLELDKNRRLVSVSINPTKVKELARIMKIVGIVKGPPDLAERHDDYFAMLDPHGGD